jgi:hypothetical protein
MERDGWASDAGDRASHALLAPSSQGVLHVGNRLRHDWLRDRKTLGRLAHRPAFDDGHQDAEVAQLKPATDPLCTLLCRDHRHMDMRS